MIKLFYFSLIAGFTTITGILIIFYAQKWVAKNSVKLIGFSAGVILTVAFIHLLPEATQFTDWSYLTVLITIIGFYILEHVLVIHHCQEDDCEVHAIGVLAITGMTIHSLLDGIIIGIGFAASNPLGFAATIGVIMHKLPDGATIATLLIHEKYEKRKILFLGAIMALATPVGALLSGFWVFGTDQQILGILLAVASGSFIYIGASDLLPETHKKHDISNIPYVISGVLFIQILEKLH